eukprot:g3243.t1
MSNMKVFTPEEGKDTITTMYARVFAKHKTKKDCWVILNNNVYNVTDFLPDHPGGKNAILLYAGKDGTKEFNMLHKPSILDRYAKQYLIGTVKEGNARL